MKSNCTCGLCSPLGDLCAICGCASGRHVFSMSYTSGVKETYGCHGQCGTKSHQFTLVPKHATKAQREAIHRLLYDKF